VIELTAKLPNHDTAMNPATNHAQDILETWQKDKVAERV
jgi:hypothetical protein